MFPLDFPVKMLKRQLHAVWEEVPVGSVPGDSEADALENVHSLDTGRI